MICETIGRFYYQNIIYIWYQLPSFKIIQDDIFRCQKKI